MERKRVGVLTFHMAHNYGAMLQAYALPTVLEELGYDGEVINYRFPYIDQWGKVDYWDDLIRKHGVMGGGLRFLKRLMSGYYNSDTLRNKFSYFERNVIPHSEAYESVEELDNLPYDGVVFGSDQIWNSRLTNGAAPVYAGAFKMREGTGKIAYAASCGMEDFCDDVKTMYLDCLKEFDRIGVRETGFCKTLREEEIDAQVVLDPTLLLTQEKWMGMVKKVPNKLSLPKRYLLVYSFDEPQGFYEYVRELGAEKGLEIVVIAYREKEEMQGMKVYTNCGPADFVNFFAHADFVVTTSFHGTAFSLIFRKEFFCVPHPEYHERTDSLLQMFCLKDREVRDFSYSDVNKEINWGETECLLEAEKKKSISFLKEALQ